MNGALLLSAFCAAPLFVLAREWLGPWAPDPSVVVLAWAALAGARTPRVTAVLVLGTGRALLLFEPIGSQLLAAWFACVVVRAAREGLREIAGPQPFLLAALLAGVAWFAGGRALGLVLDFQPLAGTELLLGALWALPFGFASWRVNRRRRWA